MSVFRKQTTTSGLSALWIMILGFFDKEVNRVEPAGENSFVPKVLPVSPV
jgi:hypothetical protein